MFHGYWLVQILTLLFNISTNVPKQILPTISSDCYKLANKIISIPRGVRHRCNDLFQKLNLFILTFCSMRNNQSIGNKVQDFHESIIFSNQYNKYLILSAVSYPSVKVLLGAYRGCLLVKEFVNVCCLHELSMIYHLIAFGSCAFVNLWHCVELPLVLYLQFILWLVSVYLVRVFGILYTGLIIYYLHHSLPAKPPDIPYVIKYSTTTSQQFPIVLWDNHPRLKRKHKRYYNSSEQIQRKRSLFSNDKIKRTTGGRMRPQVLISVYVVAMRSVILVAIVGIPNTS